MKEIKMLVEYIEEELHDSEKYAKQAVHYKEENRAMSEMFLQLSKEEMSHMERLHDHAVKCIAKAKEMHDGEAPKAMQVVWDWEHKKMIDTAARIKTMWDMAR